MFDTAVAYQAGEEIAVAGGLRADRPHGGHQQDGQPLESRSEVDGEPQRRPVRPVKIINRDQQRGIVGHIDHQPVQAMQRGKRLLGAALRRGVAAEHRPRQAGRAGEQR